MLQMIKNLIMHENRKLWIKQSEIQSPSFNKRVFYFWHARKPKIFGTPEMLCISKCPENPTLARRASKLWTIVQSGRIFMIWILPLIFIMFSILSAFDIITPRTFAMIVIIFIIIGMMILLIMGNSMKNKIETK